MTSLLYDGPLALVLASRSPRRQDLLERLGVEFDIRPADIEEIHEPGLTPRESAVLVALAKAETIAARVDEGVVLGADTIVVLDGEILGKPRDADEARTMLARLTGATHEVVTGMALIDARTGRQVTAAESTQVTMRPASADEIALYVASGEPMDKAGAYGAQGLGSVFIERVEGCFYNVVGLPLARLHHLFARFDARPAGSGEPAGEGSRGGEG